MDNASFTTRVDLHTGITATFHILSLALPDRGSSQTFISESFWEQMLAAGAANSHYQREVEPGNRGRIVTGSWLAYDSEIRPNKRTVLRWCQHSSLVSRVGIRSA